MVTNWYSNIAFFEQEKKLISKYYPSLHYVQNHNKVKLEGELYIKEIDDSYTIEVSFLDDYPKSLPIVKEIGGDIPQIDKRHINFDGSCCLCVPQLEKLYFPDGSNIKTFLDKLVVPFFANQAYFDSNGTWLNGEYRHGGQGVYDFYVELFDTLDIKQIINLIDCCIKDTFNVNKKCPCNSGRPIKKCHITAVSKLKKSASNEQLKKDIDEFKNILKKRKNRCMKINTLA